MRNRLIWLGIAVGLLLVSIKFFPYHCNCQARIADTATSTSLEDIQAVTFGTDALSVDVADTPALREQGLSGRRSLCPDCGMLFVFDKPGHYGFWMKDMNFPLDIVWIGADKVVTGVARSVLPSSYPEMFYPPRSIMYVLELPAGYFDAHHLKVGDTLVLMSQKE